MISQNPRPQNLEAVSQILIQFLILHRQFSPILVLRTGYTVIIIFLIFD